MSTLADRPAFPHLETTSRGEPYYDHLGMTLRQYYAGLALQGLAYRLSGEAFQCLSEGITGGATTARVATVLADALIAELEKPKA